MIWAQQKVALRGIFSNRMLQMLRCEFFKMSKPSNICLFKYLLRTFYSPNCLLTHSVSVLPRLYSLSWFDIKMISYQYRKSDCGDKTAVRSSYLHDGIFYTGKMASLYWFGPQTICESYRCVNPNKEIRIYDVSRYSGSGLPRNYSNKNKNLWPPSSKQHCYARCNLIGSSLTIPIVHWTTDYILHMIKQNNNHHIKTKQKPNTHITHFLLLAFVAPTIRC